MIRYTPILVFACALSAGAQQQPRIIARAGNHPNTQPLIDGSADPNKITDQTAIRIFFLTAALPPDATAAQKSRFRAQFGRLQLDSGDLAIVADEMARLYPLAKAASAKKDQIANAAKAGEPNVGPNAIIAADGVLDTLTLHSYNSLVAHLSPAGGQHLREHLIYVKSRIKVYRATM